MVTHRRDFVTFLSDYGSSDEFVGVCHAVLLKQAPHVTIVDLHHEIRRHDIRQGASVLRRCLAFVPSGVHLAVVDPGVGGARVAVALEAGSGELFVGPDNGLLLPAAASVGGVARAVALAIPSDLRAATFHGRDLFAPAAARLALGTDLGDLGEPLDPASLVPCDLPRARIDGSTIATEVAHIDTFGNVSFYCSRDDLIAAGLFGLPRVRIEIGEREVEVATGTTFSDVTPGDAVLFVDSWGDAAVATNQGDVAAELSLEPGSRVRLRPSSSSREVR